MAISFKGARYYKKRCNLKYDAEIKTPIPSPMHFYELIGVEKVVNTGDTVLAGQKLADAESFEVNPILSGCSGTVTYADEYRIAVENDMLYNTVPYKKPVRDYNELTSREVLWLMREGGVYEAKKQAPLHVLLANKKVQDCIILCCFDSDPYVASPQSAARGNTEKILKALDLCLKLSDIKKAYVAVENNTRKVFADFKAALRFNDKITPVMLKARYPQSDNKILIKTLTGRETTDALILTPETLVNMMNVLETGESVTKKIVTVAGDDIIKGENYLTPIGSTMSSVLSSGGYTSPDYVAENGALCGRRVTDLDTPISPDTTAATAFNDEKNMPKKSGFSL